MGNYLGLYGNAHNEIDIVINDIVNDELYKKYQMIFEQLYPSKGVYIDITSRVLVIETNKDDVYSYIEYEFNWNNDDVKHEVLQTLEKMYKIYSRQNIYRSSKKNATMEHSAIDFVIKTLLDDKDWDEWLDEYFYNDSGGYKMFKNMLSDYRFNSDDLDIHPYDVWEQLIASSLDHGNIYAATVEGFEDIRDLCDKYEDVIEILDHNDFSLAYMALIEGRWWYIGIDLKCLEKINECFQMQNIN